MPITSASKPTSAAKTGGLVIRILSYQLAIRHEVFAQSLLDLTPSEVESLSDEATAWKLLLETPLKAVPDLKANILIDALDESGGDGGMITLLANLDKVCGIQQGIQDRLPHPEEKAHRDSHPHSIAIDPSPVPVQLVVGEDCCETGRRLNFIVTTRAEPAVLSSLRGHWSGGRRYQEFIPSLLRGEERSDAELASPLLITLTKLIQMTRTNKSAAPSDLNTAYGMIFNRDMTEQHREVLEVVLASYQPQSLSDLKAMGLLESARRLPG
eukprot:gene32329-biopygen25712